MVGISVFGQAALGDLHDRQEKIAASKQFLTDAGFDPDAAAIIGDQGEDENYQSIPVAPLLLEAGRTRGLVEGKALTPAQTIEYVNGMPPDKVLVNRLRIANR